MPPRLVRILPVPPADGTPSFAVYKIDMMFPEYERYTEPELIKLLKQLERQKQDLISQLKNVQYQTDKESKASATTWISLRVHGAMMPMIF